MAQTTRRIATISTGTLLLCLSFGGSALAASTPTDGGTPDPVGTVTSLLSPTPTPTPSQLSPIGDAVNTVTNTVTTVVASPTPTTVPSGGGATTQKQTKAPAGTSTASKQKVMGSHTTRGAGSMSWRVPVTAMHFAGMSNYAAGSLPSISAPTVAPQQAYLAAGQTPLMAPAPQSGLPGSGSGDDRAPRGLFIALATMVIGALAAGHVKVIQDRLANVTTAA